MNETPLTGLAPRTPEGYVRHRQDDERSVSAHARPCKCPHLNPRRPESLKGTGTDRGWRNGEGNPPALRPGRASEEATVTHRLEGIIDPFPFKEPKPPSSPRERAMARKRRWGVPVKTNKSRKYREEQEARWAAQSGPVHVRKVDDDEADQRLGVPGSKDRREVGDA